ncbi:MAG: hypothetical protein KC609_13490 [Myxococcales bacterium]|nr:hypothetical protein [Myxococcales bacterium]
MRIRWWWWLLLFTFPARLFAEGQNQLGFEHRVHESTLIDVDVVSAGEVILILVGNDQPQGIAPILVDVYGPDGTPVSGSPFTITPETPGFLRQGDVVPPYKPASALQITATEVGTYSIVFDNTGGDYVYPLEITVAPSGAATIDPSTPPDGGRVHSQSWRLSTKSSQHINLFARVPLTESADTLYRIELNGVQALDWTAVANRIGLPVSPLLSAPGFPPPCPPFASLLGGVCLPAAPPDFSLYLNRPKLAAPQSIKPQISNAVIEGPSPYCPVLVPDAPNTLIFESNVEGSVYVYLDTNKDGSFDPYSEELVAVGEVSIGENVLPLPGNAIDGAPIPPGDYQLKIVLRAGELHLPLLDVAALDPGLRIFRLLPGTPGGVSTALYWNDSFVNDRPVRVFPEDASQSGVLSGDPAASEPICSIESNGASVNAHCWPFDGGVGDQRAIDSWVVADETSLVLTATVIDPNADDDQDGLTNGEECALFGTDPQNADTDHGGVDDGTEVDVDQTDPLDGGDDRICSNGKLDGDETDLDCGGSCSPCADDKICLVDEDCESGFCDAGFCKTPVSVVEYCPNATNPDDCDDDGIPNVLEDANGNGIVDLGESDFDNPDSDGDGLPDGLEDANHNGVQDPGESSPLTFDALKVRGGGGCQLASWSRPSPSALWLLWLLFAAFLAQRVALRGRGRRRGLGCLLIALSLLWLGCAGPSHDEERDATADASGVGDAGDLVDRTPDLTASSDTDRSEPDGVGSSDGSDGGDTANEDTLGSDGAADLVDGLGVDALGDGTADDLDDGSSGDDLDDGSSGDDLDDGSSGDGVGDPDLLAPDLAETQKDSDGVPPTIVLVTPANGRELGPRQRIMIVFSESMDPDALTLGGGIGSGATATWFTTVVPNDTVVLSPTNADWGSVLSVTIDGTDVSGTQLASATFSYFAFPANLPTIKVPLQAFRVSDDDGGRTTAITAQQVDAWTKKANEIYAVAGVEFLFDPNDPNDFIEIQSTLINQLGGTSDPQWIAERDAANLEASKHTENVDGAILKKAALFFRYGPGGSPTGGGFSWTDYNFVALPGFSVTVVCGHQNIQLMAHELGHYLGLAHTFGGGWSTVPLAEKQLTDNGSDPFKAFDGDQLEDTAPDPWIASLNQCDPGKMHLSLAGIPFLLPRNNIMSYYDSTEMTLSLTQLWTVRQGALVRTGQSVARILPGSVTLFEGEAQKTEVDASKTGGTIGTQNMRPFLGNWSGDTQLFWGTPAVGNEISFTVTVPNPGTLYEIYVGVTQAPDFGTFQLRANGELLGSFDAYATRVKQSVPWLIGSTQLGAGKTSVTIAIRLAGKNPASSNTHLGLDYVLLQEK